MTHHPILDTADQALAPDLDGRDLNGGQRVVDLATAERPADLHSAARAAAEFLAALGIDLDREERQATPARMARAYAELFARAAVPAHHLPQRRGL
jgi:GTP cyclohydrolase I